MMAFIFLSSLFTSCEKKDAATSGATLRTKEIVLNPTAGSTVSGKAVIAENADHSFNARIKVQKHVKNNGM